MIGGVVVDNESSPGVLRIFSGNPIQSLKNNENTLLFIVGRDDVNNGGAAFGHK